MKQYLLYVLFVLAIGSMVALVVNVFGEEQEEIRLAAAVETDLEDLPETFAVLSETFDEPILKSWRLIRHSTK